MSVEVSDVTLTEKTNFDRDIDNRVTKLEQQNSILWYYLTKGGKKDLSRTSGDENEERGNWSGRFDFFLSCLGYAVGLGNVWRFPYLCYRNGGGAFFIPYCIMLGLVGIPIFLLELSLGQFTSCGPVTCWKYAPFFAGVGYGMFIVSALVAIYYNMIIGWASYYLFASFTSVLPWEKCGDWSTNMCFDRIYMLKVNETCAMNSKNALWYANKTLGVCFSEPNTTAKAKVVGFINQTLARANDYKRVLPSEEYFDYVATGSGFSAGIQDLGPIQWKMALCYLLAFVFVVLALSKSIKTSGKVVYFTATFPYVVLIILFIRGMMLPGMEKGIEFYINPDLSRLSDSKVWKDAAVQIFFSLSASWGGLIALSSYNRFHNDCVRDTLTVAFGNCLTSVFAGFVIFSYLGYMATLLDIPVDEVAKSGPSLVFSVYPFAVTTLPIAPLWAIIFFLMLMTLGVDSEFVLVETVITSILDRFPRCREYKFMTVCGCCAVFYLLGLTLTTRGGIYMLEVMDTYSGGWSILVIALCECISLAYIYGIKRFLMDIECMVGKTFMGCIPFVVLKYWWALCWCFLTPAGCLFILIFSWVDYNPISKDNDKFPEWADALGWLMTLCTVVCIVVTAIYQVCINPGDIGEKFKKALSPAPEWGPALVKHRAEAEEYSRKFDRNYIVDPWNKGDAENGKDIPMKAKSGSYAINEGYQGEKL